MINKQKIYEKNRKHNKALNFRVDNKTYIELTLIANQKGTSRSDVCRSLLQGLVYQPPLIEKEDTRKLIKELNSLGNNLNQATKSLNKISNYFEGKSENVNKASFSFEYKKKDLFQDDRANKVANELRIDNPDEVFMPVVKQSYRYNNLSQDSKEYFDYWLDKRQRPLTKEEYKRKVQKDLLFSLNLLKKIDEESEKIWELV